MCGAGGPDPPLEKRIKLHFPASITFYNGVCLSSRVSFISAVSPSLSHVENLISIEALNDCSLYLALNLKVHYVLILYFFFLV